MPSNKIHNLNYHIQKNVKAMYSTLNNNDHRFLPISSAKKWVRHYCSLISRGYIRLSSSLPSTSVFGRRNAHSVHLNTSPLQLQEANNPIQKPPKRVKPPKHQRELQRRWQYLVSFSSHRLPFK